MSGFHDVQFPLRLALGASGGPERRTQVVGLASGREVRNGVWAGSRRRWDVSGAVSRIADVAEVTAFFEAREGRLNGFRFRDVFDDRSCAPGQTPAATDQVIGTGDGEAVSLQLVKRNGETVRNISKPVAGSVVVAIDGAVQATGWSVDALTGVVTFDAAPGEGAEVTAGFRFDCAARFDADRLETRLDGFGAASVLSVPIVEII